MAEENTQVKSTKTRRIVLICVGAALLLALVCFAALSIHYGRSFYPHTTVAGVDCGSLSAENAADYLLSLAAQETIAVRDLRGEPIADLSMSQLMDRAALTQELSALLAGQHEGKSIFAWLSRDGYTLSPNLYAGLREDELHDLLNDLAYGGQEPVAPKDAVIQLGKDGYTLQPETVGNMVDLEKCVSTVLQQLPSLQTVNAGEEREISVSNGRRLAEVTADSFAIQWQARQLDTYLNKQITIDFGNGTVYTLSPEEIYAASEIRLSKAAAICRPVREKVRTLVDQLVEEYGSDGVYAKFAHAADTRELVYYRVGDNGWILDREAMAEDLYREMCSPDEPETVTPRYDYTWYWKNYYWYYGVRDTFVEISLDNQYMWYYLNGELLVETPVVTGNIANGDDTRRGCFCINYKVADTWLTGPTWHDHVDYWMPFDDQIGLHDSSWRSEYGGDIYLTDGSHGCVNTPLEAIGTIFNNIWDGVPVIVY